MTPHYSWNSVLNETGKKLDALFIVLMRFDLISGKTFHKAFEMGIERFPILSECEVSDYTMQ